MNLAGGDADGDGDGEGDGEAPAFIAGPGDIAGAGDIVDGFIGGSAIGDAEGTGDGCACAADVPAHASTMKASKERSCFKIVPLPDALYKRERRQSDRFAPANGRRYVPVASCFDSALK